MALTGRWDTIDDAAAAVPDRLKRIEQLIRVERCPVKSRALVDWADAHFLLLKAAQTRGDEPMDFDLFPERVVPERLRIQKVWGEMVVQAALPATAVVPAPIRLLRKARSEIPTSMRYVAMQIKRAWSGGGTSTAEIKTAELLKDACRVNALGWAKPVDKNVNLIRRFLIWNESTEQQSARFSATPRSHADLKAFLFNFAVCAGGGGLLGWFLYSRVCAAYHVSPVIMTAVAKRGEQGGGWPTRGFGVAMSAAAKSQCDALGFGTVALSSKRNNVVMKRCKELRQQVGRQTSPAAKIAVLVADRFEFDRQNTQFSHKWVVVCKRMCGWIKTSRKRKRDAVALTGSGDVKCAACGGEGGLIKLNGIALGGEKWTRLCGICGNTMGGGCRGGLLWRVQTA